MAVFPFGGLKFQNQTHIFINASGSCAMLIEVILGTEGNQNPTYTFIYTYTAIVSGRAIIRSDLLLRPLWPLLAK